MSTLDEARDPETTPERLVDLARDGEWEVRAAVAGNTSAPQELLTELSRDGEWYVRRAVAKNRSAPTSTLTFLTGDEDEDVVKAAQETLATRSRSTFAWGMTVGGL